jgi:RIO kinase 1
MLGRDVDNLADYFGQFAPQLLTTRYGEEIWALYEAGSLHPDSVLTGRFEDPTDDVNLDEVIQVIEAADAEHAERLARQQAAEAVDDWTADT